MYQYGSGRMGCCMYVSRAIMLQHTLKLRRLQTIKHARKLLQSVQSNVEEPSDS